MKIEELKHGMVLNNEEVVKTFLCSPQGGMRRSLRTNSLVLISDQTKVYHDRWQNGVFLYTGMGLTGDQDFQYMQNKTLYESNVNGVCLYLFEVFNPRNTLMQVLPNWRQHPIQNNKTIKMLARAPCAFSH